MAARRRGERGRRAGRNAAGRTLKAFRCSVADRAALRALIAARLPPQLREHLRPPTAAGHRDLYFDTADGTLQARDVALRLRYATDGHAVLSLTLPQGQIASPVAAQEPAAVLAADNEVTRRIRAFVDAALLEPQIELEVMRTTRRAYAGWLWRREYEFRYDEVTLRHAGLTQAFYELQVRAHDRAAGAMDRLIAAFGETHGLRPTLVTKWQRALALRQRLEADAVTFQLAPGRSVVLVAIDDGAIAVHDDAGTMRLPRGPGGGEAAARRVLQTWFRSRVGDLARVGSAETAAGDRSVEVWIVRRMRRSAGSDVTWVAPDALVLRDPESLAAYRVVESAGLLPEGGSPRRRSGELPDPGAPDAAPVEVLDGPRSELAFIERVLALGRDPRVPLLERLRYIAIVSANLDEFYMGSAGALRQRAEQDASARERVTRLVADVSRLLEDQRMAFTACTDALRAAGITLLAWDELDETAREPLRRRFRESILPLLTPRAITVSPGHPFPTVPPLALAFAVALGEGTGPVHYAYLKLPPPVDTPRFLPATGGLVPVEQLIRAELSRVYPDRAVENAWLFRLTRLSDLTLDEAAAGNLLQAMEEDLDRRRDNPVVRVEVESGMPGPVLDMLLRELRFQGPRGTKPGSAPEVQRVPGLLALSDVRQLAESPVANGVFPVFVPRNPFPTDRSLWEELRAGDRLVHHPYDDFAATVVRFVGDAADDPDVVSLKLTLYRVGDRSPLVEALMRAARSGKDVAVFVELKARFDEARNVLSVKRLEAAGVQVVYGLVGLKNHSKVALVVRREAGTLRRYVHIGTGNYNAGTARAYTDLGLFSANPELGEDVHDLFNQLTGTSGPPQSGFRRLVVAPAHLLPAIIGRIDREAQHARGGKPGVIRAKMNGLDDPEVIAALYRASQAGVEIDLIVRGICTLRPGVAGLSDRIRVRSILGRFLEHARIYYFGNAGEPEYFIASADWRSRNLRRRVEAAAPVTDAALRAFLETQLRLELDDPTAWLLEPDGSYTTPQGAAGEPRSAQSVTLAAALVQDAVVHS